MLMTSYEIAGIITNNPSLISLSEGSRCDLQRYSEASVFRWGCCLFFSTQQAPPTPNSTSPFPQWEEADLEEQQLRQKLNKMADNIRDQSESSEEEDEEAEEEKKPSGLSIRPASRSSIIFSRLEKHQSDSEKVDTHHPFLLRGFTKCQQGHEKHIWTVGPRSLNSIIVGSQFKHESLSCRFPPDSNPHLGNSFNFHFIAFLSDPTCTMFESP